MLREDSLYNNFSNDCERYYQEQAATIGVASYSEALGDSILSFINRIFDLALGFIGLLLAIPIMAIFGALIKMEDGGPIFYKQERVGLQGKHFMLYKLRSMTVNAEKNGAQWAEVDDPRVTRVGKFIRKTRIDELPQLLNVILGDMTIVGPRPERPEFVIQFDQEVPGFILRLRVKPGLTGWAQVNGGYDITPKEKLELDLYYIQNRSLRLNLRIFLKTFAVLLTGEGAR